MTTVATADPKAIPTLPIMDRERIDAPGAYVLLDDGMLMRVPSSGVKSDGPVWSFVSSKPVLVSRISTDPFVAIGRARAIAAAHDLPTTF